MKIIVFYFCWIIYLFDYIYFFGVQSSDHWRYFRNSQVVSVVFGELFLFDGVDVAKYIAHSARNSLADFESL